MFLFVFYFQGVQGNSPVLAGLKLAPLALGMLISSPLAGIWADRRGSRGMAVMGMLVTALGLALMTTLDRDTTYWAPGIFMLLVGIGSGMFNSPNTAAMMGAVPAHRRGIAAGARVLVQNTGAVISIAFVIAVVTSSVPKTVLFAVFSGVANHITNAQLTPFISNMHTALWCLCGISLVGAVVAAARPSERRAPVSRGGGGAHVSTTAERPLRIGEVAELTGTTPRTIRYYEEIGLLPGASDRAQGKHRFYTAADVERVSEIVRLRDLLGPLARAAVAIARGRGRAGRAPPRVSADGRSDRPEADSRAVARPHRASSSSWSATGAGSSSNSRRSSRERRRLVQRRLREVSS